MPRAATTAVTGDELRARHRTYASSKHLNAVLEGGKPCNRCHTHQGAVLAAKSHFTGDGDVMEAGVGAPGDITAADAEPIKCDTCHETHDAKTLRVDTAWFPSTTVGATPSRTTSTVSARSAMAISTPAG